MSAALSSSLVSPDQRREFHERGYFILENVVPDAHLRLFRDEEPIPLTSQTGEERQGGGHAGRRVLDLRRGILHG